MERKLAAALQRDKDAESELQAIRARLAEGEKKSSELGKAIAEKEAEIAQKGETIESQKSEIRSWQDKFNEAMDALREYSKYVGKADAAENTEQDHSSEPADSRIDQNDDEDVEKIEDVNLLRDRCKQLRENIEDLEMERDQMIKIIQFFNDNASDATLEKLREALEADQEEGKEEEMNEADAPPAEAEGMYHFDRSASPESDIAAVKKLIPKAPEKAVVARDAKPYKR